MSAKFPRGGGSKPILSHPSSILPVKKITFHLSEQIHFVNLCKPLYPKDTKRKNNAISTSMFRLDIAVTQLIKYWAWLNLGKCPNIIAFLNCDVKHELKSILQNITLAKMNNFIALS